MTFQFHYGSVKSIVANLQQQIDGHFNSTMVRLKGNPGRQLRRAQLNFNSTMVRLKDIFVANAWL